MWTGVAAENTAHGFYITALVRPVLRPGTAKGEDGVEGFFAVGADEEVLFKDSMD